YLDNYSSYYHKKLDVANISIEDINKIPITTFKEIKKEVEKTNDPFAGNLTVPWELVYRFAPDFFENKVPNFIAYTENDWNLLSNLLTRIWYMAGIYMGDLVHVLTSEIDIRQRIFFQSLSQIGAVTLNCMRQAMDAKRIMITIKHLKPTFFIGPPAMARAMINVCPELGIEPADLLKCYKKVIFTEKTVKEEQKDYLREKGWSGEFYYFRHNCIANFFAIDCEEHQGLHVPEDYFIVEAVNPKTGEPVGDGEEGALSITNLLFRTTPHLRFTLPREKVKILKYQCPCGRNTARIIYTK
ncbi:MAG: phenylacetate--CoA ligase family protein, partial [Candidatus Helarchaeota archaeon]